MKERERTVAIASIAAFLLMAMTPFVLGAHDIDTAPVADGPVAYDPLEDPLVKAGYRPMYPYEGSQFIQTPEPMPDDAVMVPYGAEQTRSSAAPTRATWTLYHSSTVVDVYIDTSTAGGGSLSSQEKDLLDRLIDDFKNFSFPRVKDYFDPNDLVSTVDWKIWKIDGYGGVGGYYSPGTDEFNMDRSDMSWGGIIAAHEFEHYVHRQYDIYETLWVDEGCADFGAYLVYGLTSVTAQHLYAFLEYRPTNTLPVSDQTFYNDGTTSYYGSSFIYQYYMVNHYRDRNYTRALVASTQRGTSGVTRALQVVGSSDDFVDSFNKWKVATRINDNYADDGVTYAYPVKTYDYGSLNVPVTRAHNGIPIQSYIGIGPYSITTVRFSSPPDPLETYRLKLNFNAGTPDVAIYRETNAPRAVEFVDFGGGRSKNYDMTGWGVTFSSFQVIVSSSEAANFAYDLDVLDLVPPVTTIDVYPSAPNGIDGWYTTSPRLMLESESGIVPKYSLDGSPYQDYADPIYLSDGIHNITYYSFDRHGNTEAPKFAIFKVDMVVPTSVIEVSPDMPADTWLTKAPTITLSSSDPLAKVEYKWGNDAYIVYSTPILAPEGESNLFWRAVDQAGNAEELFSRSFKVDTQVPTFVHSLYPAVPDGMDGWYITTPQLTMSSSDAKVLYYSMDRGSYVPYTSMVAVEDGEHTIKMMAVDQAGNTAPEVRLTVKVDTIEPSMVGSFDGLQYDPSNASKWTSATPVLILEGSEEGMLINYTINESPAVAYTTYLEVPEGPNSIWVHGRDKAGNMAESLFFMVNVDRKAPFIEAHVDKAPVEGWYRDSEVTVQLSTLNEDNRSSQVKISYKWDGGSESTYRNPMKVLDGRHTLTYWAVDLAGNRMEPRNIDLNKDSTLPSIQVLVAGLDEDDTVGTGKNITFDLSGSSDESGLSFFAIVVGEEDPVWVSTPFHTMSFDGPGNYTVTAYVRDQAGNVQSQAIKVNVEAPPEVKPVDEGPDMVGPLLFGLIFGAVLLLALTVLAVLLVKKRRDEKAIVEDRQRMDLLKARGPVPSLNGSRQPTVPPAPVVRTLPPAGTITTNAPAPVPPPPPVPPSLP